MRHPTQRIAPSQKAIPITIPIRFTASPSRFAAEMVGHCGIDYWEPNRHVVSPFPSCCSAARLLGFFSAVVHATSKSPEGPYHKRETILPTFAHEPNAVRGPLGEWIIYATVRNPNGYPTVDCSNSSAKPPLDRDRSSYAPKNRSTFMIFSEAGPWGPWSAPVLVLQPNMSSWGGLPALVDTNLAMTIMPDGSAIGIWRKYERTDESTPTCAKSYVVCLSGRCENTDEFGATCVSECCTFPHALRASNWRDPKTYVPDARRLFPGLLPYGSEDPFVWREADGSIHAIMHDEQGPSRCTALGRHAFSFDNGTSWVYASSNAYNGSVSFTNGSSFAFYRRERPHLILDKDGRPTHLTNGVQETTTDDRSYTLVQKLRR